MTSGVVSPAEDTRTCHSESTQDAAGGVFWPWDSRGGCDTAPGSEPVEWSPDRKHPLCQARVTPSATQQLSPWPRELAKPLQLQRHGHLRLTDRQQGCVLRPK